MIAQLCTALQTDRDLLLALTLVLASLAAGADWPPGATPEETTLLVAIARRRLDTQES